MNSTDINKILRLSRKDKIKLLQTLWNDIAKEQKKTDIPQEHLEILDKRIQKLERGKMKFRNWDEVKKKYLEDQDL